MTSKIISLEKASMDDCPSLAVMNKHLIDDEGSGNKMTIPELETRMRDWLQKGVYTAFLFKLNEDTIGYALVDLANMWMRQFFICREHRRSGYGRTAAACLFEHLGLDEIGLSCLVENERGQAFWRSFNHEIYSIEFKIQKPEEIGTAEKTGQSGDEKVKESYNKLVRDKIPEIILSKGDTPVTEVLSDDEYFKALNQKLQEEVAEYLEDFETEELADIIEVIFSIAEQKGVSRNDLEKIRAKKHEERGGFHKKINLIEVEKGEN